jgi:hypothetical protein
MMPSDTQSHTVGFQTGQKGYAMERYASLSGDVSSYIDSLDWDRGRGLSPEKQAEERQARRMIEAIVDDLISSRETLGSNKLACVEKLTEAAPELMKGLLDERFTRDLIDAVPGCVNRMMQLSRLQASRPASQVTNVFLQEAVRTYVLGLPQASVALSRAALEQALKENLGYQGQASYIEMKDLLDEAERAGVIDKTLRRMARRVADEADDVLHEKPTSITKAYEVLLLLRGILQHVYSEP